MKAVAIKKLTLKRFRSFPSATAEFSNPVFMVGRNGAGKSNLANLFSFIADAMTSPLQAVFDRCGGIEAVRNRSSIKSAPPNIGVRLDFGSWGDLHGGHFSFEIKALPNYGFQVVREQCLVRMGAERFWYNRENDFTTNAEGLRPALEPASLCLPMLGGDRRFAPAFQLLSNMRVYAISPDKLRDMQDPDSGLVLKPDGSNAASVLQELLRQQETQGCVEEINRFLTAIVPFTKSVKPKKHGNKVSLAFNQEWNGNKSLNFEAFSMSDGTLRSLGLIMAVFQKSAPSVLVIEEPEATIHPGALGAVLDLIRRATRNMQVIVTTHSPELLDDSWIEDTHLRIVSWEAGASRILLPSEATRTAMRQHIMGAGELLRSNALNPMESNLFEQDARLEQPDLFELLEHSI